MDCDEKYDSIQDKLNGLWPSGKNFDPLDSVMEILRKKEHVDDFREMGSIEVPSWLLPNPSSQDRSKVNTGEFISFIDQDGCRKMADEVKQFVSQKILPDIPCMVGIDHSLTGGAFKAVSDFYGKENVTLIVIDSHTDAIPMSVHADAIQYDIDTNPATVHDGNDPYLYNRPDSYNASSFLYHMLNEEDVMPQNLYLLGVSDYPDKKIFRIKDARIKRYTNAYAHLRGMGCTIVTKKECLLSPKKVKAHMQKISTPYVYISVDMDIGAVNAVEGVRFRNWKGLNEKKIYKLVDAVCAIFSRNVKLAGMDITEIDPRRAGEQYDSGRDQTYEIAANIITKIAFEQ